MPIILNVDGPNLGGFVSCATVVSAEFWKIDQAVLGADTIRFRKIGVHDAEKLRREQEELVAHSIAN